MSLHRRRRPARVAAVLLAAVLLAAGCSSGSGSGSGSGDRPTVAEVVRRAIEIVKEARRGASGSGTDERAAGDRQVLRADTKTAFDYEEYQSLVSSVIGNLQAYWSEVLPRDFGVPFPPVEGHVYYRPEEGGGPSCGPERAPARNAFYCPVGDFIAWDETGLLIPYYVAGDFAAAYVLAHEYGHAVQVRLRVRPTLGVLRELQADCFAGAWSKHVEDQGLLEAGDLTEATMAIYEGRDLPDTQFTDPQAHGSAAQRGSAFEEGFREGPTGCRELQVPDA